MTLKYRITLLFLFSVFLLFSSKHEVQAERPPILVSISLGGSEVRQSAFKVAPSANFTLGIDLDFMNIDLGYLNLGRFSTKKAQDTDIKVEGFTLAAIKGFPLFDILHFDFKAGLYHWRADARFLGNPLGKDKGTDAWVSGGLGLQYSPKVGVFLNMEMYFGISGSTIDRIAIGGSYRF